MQVEQILCHIFLANTLVIVEPDKKSYSKQNYTDYYGGTFNFDTVRSIEFLDAVKENGIDYSKIKIEDNLSEKVFNGTFDEADVLEFMVMTIVINNTDYMFGIFTNDMDFSLIKIINYVNSNQISYEEAISKFEKNLQMVLNDESRIYSLAKIAI